MNIFYLLYANRAGPWFSISTPPIQIMPSPAPTLYDPNLKLNAI